jgi:hypothetical protein
MTGGDGAVERPPRLQCRWPCSVPRQDCARDGSGVGGTVLKGLVLGGEAWKRELVSMANDRADKATTARLGSRVRERGTGCGDPVAV